MFINNFSSEILKTTFLALIKAVNSSSTRSTESVKTSK